MTALRDFPIVWYRFGGETWLYLNATPAAGTAQNAIAGGTSVTSKR
jgi:hypothetical protein